MYIFILNAIHILIIKEMPLETCFGYKYADVPIKKNIAAEENLSGGQCLLEKLILTKEVPDITNRKTTNFQKRTEYRNEANLDKEQCVKVISFIT
jgi:hypothetical protein